MTKIQLLARARGQGPALTARRPSIPPGGGPAQAPCCPPRALAWFSYHFPRRHLSFSQGPGARWWFSNLEESGLGRNAVVTGLAASLQDRARHSLALLSRERACGHSPRRQSWPLHENKVFFMLALLFLLNPFLTNCYLVVSTRLGRD